MSNRCEDTALISNGDECDVVTDNVRFIFQVINFVIILQMIDLFGTAANIINIMCFVKQGISDPVNIAFIGLSLSELLSLVILIWHNICLIPMFYESDVLAVSPFVAQLTAGTPHVAFTRVTCCITAFITLERCMCVVLPLKVKQIFTAKRVTIIIITIYIVILSSNMAPAYYTTRLTMLPNPTKPNKTWLGIAFTEDQPIVEKYSFAINNCLIPFSTFTIISIATVVMAKSLWRKTKWREASTGSRNSDSLPNRDKAVSKMVVLIAVLFIVCYAPVCGIFIGKLMVPKFSIYGHYRNLNGVLISFAYMLESVNASFSIYIYYNMSCKYRQAFRQAVCFLHTKDQHNKEKRHWKAKVNE